MYKYIGKEGDELAGRPRKAGLDYFELDCHVDEKIRLIQAEYGLKGFAIVVKLYQKIYGELGYYCEWNEDSSLLFMSENGVSSRDEKNLIQEIVSACVRRGIFSEELYKKYGVLTSVGVQEKYLNAVSRRESVELKKEYLLVKVDHNSISVNINSISVDRNSKNDDRNSQSKEEKRKVEYRKKNIKKYVEDENLNQAITDFVEYREKIKKPMTDHAVDLMIKKLRGMTDSTAEQIRILEQSIVNGWTGIYEVKAQDKAGGKKAVRPKPNQFHNFDQRDTDYSTLVQDQVLGWLGEGGEEKTGGGKDG